MTDNASNMAKALQNSTPMGTDFKIPHQGQASGDFYSYYGEPLLSDVTNPESKVLCPLCPEKMSITLHWCEYEPPPSNGKKSQQICDHCFLPPPNGMDFIQCKRNKHIFCIFCTELKLFRIQLGLFAMTDDDEANLGTEWEKDYVRFRNQRKYNGNKNDYKLCGCLPIPCINSNKPQNEEEIQKRNSIKTTRLAGYTMARDQYADSQFDFNLSKTEYGIFDDKDDKKGKNKRNRASSAFEIFGKQKDSGLIVDEGDVDEFYSQNIKISNQFDIIIDKNTKKAKAVSLLIERLGLGNDVKLPPAIIELDYDKYGVYCFTYVISKLEQKQRSRLFMILEYICMVSPTSLSINLIHEYRKQLLMFPKKEIDSVFLAVIRGSKYSIATSLKIAAIAAEFGEIDLARKSSFEALADKYEGIAIALIQQIESHHLASLILETPTEIDGLSPLEIAFEFQMYKFLAQSKIQKISHQIWFKPIFLSPENNFEVSDPNSWDVLSFLTSKPRQFFFLPIGKFMTQICLFTGYLLIFTFILGQLTPSLFDQPTYIEIIFWFMNLGYIGYEVYECFIESGVTAYLTSWLNWLDMTISLNFASQIVFRLIFLFAVDSSCFDKIAEYNYSNGAPLTDYKVCPSSAQIIGDYWPGSGSNQCGDFFDRYQYQDIQLPDHVPYDYGNELCTWYPKQLNDDGEIIANGTFYTIFDLMGNDPDVIKYKCNCWKSLDIYMKDSCCRKESESKDSALAIIFNLLYGINAILLWTRILHFFEQNATLGPLLKVLGKMKNDVANYVNVSLVILIGFGLAVRTVIGKYSGEFYTLQSTFFYMFQSSFLKINFGALATCGDEVDRLCADDGWVTNWRSNLTQVLMCIYLVIALLLIRLLIAMVTYTYNNTIKKSEHQVMYTRIKNAYESDRSSGLMPPPLNIVVFGIGLIWMIMDILMVILINRYIDVENQFQLSKPKGKKYLNRLWNGIKDLFNKSSGYWICAYCKIHNDGKKKYNIEEYVAKFKPLPDEQDVNLIKIYSPNLCRNCYRNKYSVNRSTIVLEQISYVVFLILVFPILWLSLFIPGLIKGFLEFLRRSASYVSIGDKDDDNIDPGNDPNNDEDMYKKYVKTNSDKFKKLNKKEKKKFKKLYKKAFEKAEKVRIARQVKQLDAQLHANPDSSNSSSAAILRKNLKNMIINFRRDKHKIVTPNIAQVVDNVTSDKTPIFKLGLRLEELDDKLDTLFKVIKASAHMQVATTLQYYNNDNNNSNNNIDIDMNKKDQKKLNNNNSNNNNNNDNNETKEDIPKTNKLNNNNNKKKQKKKNRCWQCNKKITLAGRYQCKCGYTFCGVHRYADEHNCEYDRKHDHKKKLEAANPEIKFAKLNKI